MSAQSKAVNGFFRKANRSDIDRLLGSVLFSDRQEQIFNMFYLRKKDVNYIADYLNYSPDTINKELKKIREKLCFFLPL